MSQITTHVLDTSCGRPASAIDVILETQNCDDNSWKKIGQGCTDKNGRVSALLDTSHSVKKGLYRLTFDTESYFNKNALEYFFPRVQLFFRIDNPVEHYHVPLLLSPFGYSTYRGS